MSIKCAWCGDWLVKSTPVGLISHAICKGCAAKVLAAVDNEEETEKPCRTH